MAPESTQDRRGLAEIGPQGGAEGSGDRLGKI